MKVFPRKIGAPDRLSVWLGERARPRSEEALRRSALVVAPHPDDETLGCGGTVIRKRQLGADVRILFMTDGSASHRHLLSARQLAAVRKEEALAAADTLGCRENDVRFLDFEDGQLSNDLEDATQAVHTLLERDRPEEVYVPYAEDGPPDHEATYEIVMSAIRQSGRPIQVYEYPIWYWHHWPWISLSVTPRRKSLHAFGQSLARGFGISTFRLFRSGVYVGHVLPQKRSALDCHRSQMTSLTGDPNWQTLRGVAGGDFLDCFFRPFELFRATHVSPNTIHSTVHERRPRHEPVS